MSRKILFCLILILVACRADTAVSPTIEPLIDPTAVPNTPTPLADETAVPQPSNTPQANSGTIVIEDGAETAVQTIELSGSITNRNAEVSGMAWYGDTLILMPQYPDFERGKSVIFAIPKGDILAYLDGIRAAPITPIEVPFESSGVGDRMRGFEGYEAIVFDGEIAYLTIEVSGGGMQGFVLRGQIEPDLSQFTMVGPRMTEIEQPVNLGNRSDESILIYHNQVVTFYESNGPEVNPAPMAHLFLTGELNVAGTAVFPHIPYRITDVTMVDEDGRFWAINYNFPGDRAIQEADSLIANYTEGESHQQSDGVERLVEFQFSDNGIIRVEQPPIQLQLLPDDLRNWEGIVRLDDAGFLLVTDKFPETILGYVPVVRE